MPLSQGLLGFSEYEWAYTVAGPPGWFNMEWPEQASDAYLRRLE